MTAPCPERLEDLSALLDGALAADEVWALEEHLVECAGCRAEREALAQVVAQVRGLPRRPVPAHFGAAVMARVLEAGGEGAGDDAPPGEVVLLVEEPAPPAAPPLSPGPAECAAVGEELSALIDGELTGEARDRVEAHLAACVPCDAEMWALDRQRTRLRTLPRLRPPELFARQVMARLEAEALAAEDRSRRLAAERARRVRQVGWVLRAASLVGAAALSLQLTAPTGAGGAALPPPAPATASWGGAATREAAALAGGPAAEAEEPPLAGTFDATLELRAPQGLDPALDAAVRTALARAELLGTRRGDARRELGVRVPAQLVDDLYRDLDALAEVTGTPEALRSVEALTLEQDRVVLRSGVVLAGRVVTETPREVVIDAGGLRQKIDRRRVERVERASQPRTVRVVLRGEGGP
ncbi:MAG: zf-HC2 domain-containing protein [Planctomycetes bacterium]|nr:zf-HC2 domain-containing protein [Planctomycetota bacterium]